MFRMVFQLLEEKYGIQPQWKYIHGSGLLGVPLDQGTSVIEQIQNSVKLCGVHFQRGVERLLGEGCPRGEDSTYNLLMSLLRCQTRRDYMELCDKIGGKYAKTLSEPFL
jgi:hypothetical protein